jgi:hypothetical protein
MNIYFESKSIIISDKYIKRDTKQYGIQNVEGYEISMKKRNVLAAVAFVGFGLWSMIYGALDGGLILCTLGCLVSHNTRPTELISLRVSGSLIPFFSTHNKNEFNAVKEALDDALDNTTFV